MQSGIYLIRNRTTGTLYIGSAVNISKRFSLHVWHLRNNRHHNSRLQREWLAHGEGVFTFSVLLICAKTDLIFFEQRAIDVFLASAGRRSLYNASLTAGSTLGVKFSDEAKAKISATSKGRWTGKKHTAETKLKMSLSGKGKNLGRRASVAARQKMSAFQKGRPKSAEHRAKIGNAQRGRIQSPEAIAKTAAALRGRKLSPEHVAKMRAGRKYKGSQKGRKLSAATRAKMSASHKGKGMGRVFSVETRAKMSAAKKGKPSSRKGIPMSQETKQKISAALTGRKIPPEIVAKAVAAQKAQRLLRPPIPRKPRPPKPKLPHVRRKEYVFTEEHKAKIGAANSKPRSESGRANILKGQQARRLRERVIKETGLMYAHI